MNFRTVYYTPVSPAKRREELERTERLPLRGRHSLRRTRDTCLRVKGSGSHGKSGVGVLGVAPVLT